MSTEDSAGFESVSQLDALLEKSQTVPPTPAAFALVGTIVASISGALLAGLITAASAGTAAQLAFGFSLAAAMAAGVSIVLGLLHRATFIRGQLAVVERADEEFGLKLPQFAAFFEMRHREPYAPLPPAIVTAFDRVQAQLSEAEYALLRTGAREAAAFVANRRDRLIALILGRPWY